MAIQSLASGSEDQTARLAEGLAAILKPGDLVTLSGDLGAGKTVFTRAMIRWLASDTEMDVPSPTYGLVHAYDHLPMPVAHADFYRLDAPEEAHALDLENSLDHGIVLVEWPQNGELPKAPDFDITLMADADTTRRIEISTPPANADRLTRMARLSRFLDASGFAGVPRSRLQGDASTRRYERLRSNPAAILMDAPRQTDGPVVKDGKPYSRLVHLAEDVLPFVAIGTWLSDNGLSAPDLFASDVDNGFVILEDLGQAGVIDDHGTVIEERYMAALDTLAHLHRLPPPGNLRVGGLEHRVQTYNPGILAFEAELFADWFLPEIIPGDTTALADSFRQAWSNALSGLPTDQRVLVLRDFHSPNLIWLGDRAPENRVGLIDFQDAMIGHPAYDVASLCQDARLTISRSLETALLDHYRSLDAVEDWPAFEAAYALLSAQRATKILGIFVRLYRRDGKPVYLRHLPRLADYLSRSLDHAAFEPVRAWHADHLPMARLVEACDTLSRLESEAP